MSGVVTENIIVAWLQERLDNCMRIAATKSGDDEIGWLADANMFSMAIETIRGLERRLMEAPPDAMFVGAQAKNPS